MTDSSSPQTGRAFRGLRLELLWFIFAISVIAGFISLTPTAPHDFWWHLKAGELIANGAFPQTNLFAWTLPADHPYIYQSWLGEWLFYAFYWLGGLPLVIFVRNLLGAIAFGLVAYETRLRTGSWRLGALAALLAAAMTINNLNARTQNWSWLPFIAVFMLLSRYIEGRLDKHWLIALPLVMIFWVNAHGAFIMGLLVAGAFVAGETLRRWLKQPRALNWEKLRWLYLTLLGMGVATLINPLGFGIWIYVQSLLSDTAIQTLVSEWQSPNPRTIAGAAFYLGILAVIAAFAFARRRPTITEVLLVCGLAWQAVTSGRHVMWFGMAAMPIAAQSLLAAKPVFSLEGGAAKPSYSGRERGGGALANMLVAVALIFGVLLLQPWVKPLLPFPVPYQELFAPMPGAELLFNAETPVAAVEHLRAEPCAGKIFNEMGYGSYMAWALYPAAQSFIDPRIELYPLELWQDYVKLSRGQDAQSLLAHYDISCVLLDTQNQGGLAEAMPTMAGWELSSAEGRSEVWRRQ